MSWNGGEIGKKFSSKNGQVLEEVGIGVAQPYLTELCSLGSGRVVMGSLTLCASFSPPGAAPAVTGQRRLGTEGTGSHVRRRAATV